MLLKELISTCSHPSIAEAAVVSIGPVFYARIAREAQREDLSVGEYASRAVRRFSAQASGADWDDLRKLCAGEDMPILRGLHHILEIEMEEGDREDETWRACIASLENAARRAVA